MAASLSVSELVPRYARELGSADRPPVGAHGNRPALAELFGSPLRMALGAEAADVAVLVAAALGERHDVVRHGRLADNPGGGAIAAEGFRP